MISFATKLNSALSLLEMAQLVKHDFKSPRLTSWDVSFGKGFQTVSRKVNSPTADEARKEVEEYRDYDSFSLKDYFGVDSFEELEKSVRVVPQHDVKADYNERDTKSLSTPKTWDRVSELLSSGPGDYKWHILAIDRTLHNYTDVKNYVAENYPDIDIDNSITFLKGGSSGDALDADMLIHTAGHAVAKAPGNGRIAAKIESSLSGFAEQVSNLMKAAIDTNDPASAGVDIEKIKQYKQWYRVDVIISQFLHFKAAKSTILGQIASLSDNRRNNFSNRGFGGALEEIAHEMISTFIKRDKVRFEPNDFCCVTSPEILARATALKEEINQALRIMLDNCVGKIIID